MTDTVTAVTSIQDKIDFLSSQIHTASEVRYKKCSIDWCDGNAHASAFGAACLCVSHYHRKKRYGDPNKGGRFYGEIDKWIEKLLKEDPDHCVAWPFSVGKNGYGSIGKNGERTSANRYICKLVNGEPSDSKLEAAHSCGKGHEACVTPKHLSWKTKKDNTLDKVAHGTQYRGDAAHGTKIKFEQVLEIRESNEPLKVLASRYGVSESTISVVRRKLTRVDA